MTIEISLPGVACNLSCGYCYQIPMRDAQNIRQPYNEAAIMAEIEKIGEHFVMFGGEALLTPKNELERFWKLGLEKFGQNGIQTNGVLIDDEHIELFKKYKVSVGISVDGPGELNDFRWAGTLEKTREATDKTIANIEKLVKEGLTPGVIITLHKGNATAEKLPKLLEFMDWLGELGIDGNVHTLETENPIMDELYALSEEENIAAFLAIAEFLYERPYMQWKPFSDIPALLRGDDRQSTCFWNYCDPLNTQAVHGIDADGALSNCGRVNKEGVNWYKAESSPDFNRYISLYYTPQDMQGCQGCRYWIVCGGSCPGEGMNYDWRNKTSHCGTMKAMIGFFEKKVQGLGMTPITLVPELPVIEELFLEAMRAGRTPGLYGVYDAAKERIRQRNGPVQVPVRRTETVEEDEE